MKFTHGTRRRAAEYEKDWVQRWKDDQTFEKSVAQRPADDAYVFMMGRRLSLGCHIMGHCLAVL